MIPKYIDGKQIPQNHRLDGRAFYAAKTAGNERERYLFGWNPTKEESIFGFWTDKELLRINFADDAG